MGAKAASRSAAWSSVLDCSENHGQAGLVKYLQDQGTLKSYHCVQAMLAVDRKEFVDGVPAQMVHQDHPLPNGPTETISAPHMHATALELLAHQLKPGARVLDVGSGSGYLTACFAYATLPTCTVIGIEKFNDLAAKSLKALTVHHAQLLESKRVQILQGNVYSIAEELSNDPVALFDAIHVGAAADSIPEVLQRLLAPGGRMIVPIGPPSGSQALWVVDRFPCEDSSEVPRFKHTKLMPVKFVPLTHPEASCTPL